MKHVLLLTLIATLQVFGQCPVTLGKTSAITYDYGNGIIPVFAAPSCAWTASTTASWLQFNSTGTGYGEVRYAVFGNNTGVTRTVLIQINDKTFTVINEPNGTASFRGNGDPPIRPSGGSVTYIVEPYTTGGSWTAEPLASWLTVFPASGSGIGNVFITASPNNGLLARTGEVKVAGYRLQVTQSGLDQGLRFVPVSPCRLVDTRETQLMNGGSARDFFPSQTVCGIPANAFAYSLNATVVPRGPLAYLTLWPSGAPRPLVSTLNSFDGRIKANAAIVPAGVGGAITAFVTDTTDLILDINGYFVPAVAGNSQTTYGLEKAFIGDCRALDTRTGAPFQAGDTRTIDISSVCGAGVAAKAYVLNVTVLPRSGPFSYLTIWPAGGARPLVSTLNSPTGTVVANAAIVPATNGAVSLYVTHAADVIIDVSGAFVAGTGSYTMHYYPLNPCRVSDTRGADGLLGGPSLQASQARAVAVPMANCGTPTSNVSRAYVLNATVLPPASLGFLTLSPTNPFYRPPISTLNAFDGAATSNLAIVSGGLEHMVDAFVSDRTHLILDIMGFFSVP